MIETADVKLKNLKQAILEIRALSSVHAPSGACRYEPPRLVAETVLVHQLFTNNEGEVAEELKNNNVRVGHMTQVSQINDEINANTEGLIPQMIEDSEAYDSKVMLSSRTELRGKWQREFWTYQSMPFNLTATTQKTLSFCETTSHHTKIHRGQKYDIILLSLGTNSDPSVMLILPKVIANSKSELLNLVCDSQGLLDVGQFLNLLKEEPDEDDYCIRMPMFKFESQVDLQSAVSNCSLNSPVMNDLKTLFNGMTKCKFFKNMHPISSQNIDIHTGAQIDFRKEGIATSSKTMMCMTDSADPYGKIVFNRPFMLLTLDNRQKHPNGKLLDACMVFM